jgi:hypothetical protein
MQNSLDPVYKLFKSIASDQAIKLKPQSDIAVSSDDSVIPRALVRGTRGYIEKTVFQINGCYQNSWFDACAAMIRKLIEILIIEVYESNKRLCDITDSKTGRLFTLDELISVIISDPSWRLGLSTKRGLEQAKALGDKAVHNRKGNTYLHDIEPFLQDFRLTIQELLYLSKLK